MGHKAIKTYYDDLQVARSAAPEVITAAYRSLSLKYHPDRNLGDARSEQLMKAINEAYGALSDPVKRKAHDDWIAAQEAKADYTSNAGGKERDKPRSADPKSRRKHPTTSDRKNSWSPKAATRDIMQFKYPILANLRKFGALYVVIALLFVFWAANAVDTDTTQSDDYAAAQREKSFPDTKASVGAGVNPLLDAMNAAHPPKDSNGNEAEGESEHSGPWVKYQNENGNFQISGSETQATTSSAPNGSKWPTHAGYVKGYERLNTQGLSRVVIDNSRNSSDAFVKLVDVSQGNPRAVRSIFVPAYESYTINSISPGQYDIRYRDLEDGGLSRSESFTLFESKENNSTRYKNITITLYKVAHGNMETYAISENEFSSL
jgi:curved DNA-binding protein CbpA